MNMVRKQFWVLFAVVAVLFSASFTSCSSDGNSSSSSGNEYTAKLDGMWMYSDSDVAKMYLFSADGYYEYYTAATAADLPETPSASGSFTAHATTITIGSSSYSYTLTSSALTIGTESFSAVDCAVESLKK